MTSPESPPSDSLRSRLLAWSAILGVLALLIGWLFRSVLFQGGLLSFRDSLHFYYPLFDFIQQEWEAGRIPLWNPYSNSGEPLLASPTSSVLYPLKLIFFLPASYWARYHAYILVHVLLAGLTSAWAARRWGASPAAAALAGISYACGGNILINYCNVVFLCGAAWLPLAFWSGARLIDSRSVRHVPLFSMTLALMVLGGDPQLAYEAGLLVALYAAMTWFFGERSVSALRPVRERAVSAPAADHNETGHGRWAAWTKHRLVLLVLAAGLGGLLSAVQILPTQAANRTSVRAAREVPSNLFEVPGYLFRQRDPVPRPDTGRPPHWYDALVGDPPPPAKHELSVYGYSFAPWRLVEFLWPNVTGRYFPDDSRWMFILDAEPSVWVPSQYIGLWTFLLALAALRFRTGDVRGRWLTVIVLLTFVASWGVYGLGWVGRHVSEWMGESPWKTPTSVNGGIGGLYWLLSILLPGFSEFRYPAKLMVLTNCGLSLLAAQGLDRLAAGGAESAQESRTSVRWIRILGGLAILSLAWLAFAWLAGDWFQTLLNSRKRSRNFAFDSAGAIRDITLAGLQTLVLALVSIALVRLRFPSSDVGGGWLRRVVSGSSALAWIVLALTAVDLGLANAPLVHTVDRRQWEGPPPPALAGVIERVTKEEGRMSARPVRIARSNSWINPLDPPDRYPLEDRVDWQRWMIVVRQNVPLHIGVVASFGTLDNNEHEAWYDTLPLPDKGAFLAPRRSYDAWGTEYFVVDKMTDANSFLGSTVGLRTSWPPSDAPDASPIIPFGPPLRQVNTEDDGLPPGVLVLKNDSPFPAAWIVHRVLPLEPISPGQRDRWLPVMMQLVFPRENPIDLHETAVVEDAALAAEFAKKAVQWGLKSDAAESCRVVRYEPGELEIEAVLGAEGVVVLSDTYSPDWKGAVATGDEAFRSVPLLQTNRTMRGVRLPAGRHRVRMTYAPRSFYIGAAFSGAAWLGVIGLLGLGPLVDRLRRRRAPDGGKPS